jgi:hypothetical protein
LSFGVALMEPGSHPAVETTGAAGETRDCMPTSKTSKPTGAKASHARDLSRAEVIAKKLAKVAPDDDPAVVAGAIVIFATENIKRSAKTLPDARAYLNGMRDAIDGFLINAFPPPDKTGDK